MGVRITVVASTQLLALLALAGTVGAQQGEGAYRTYRTDLVNLAADGGWWLTSNAEYAAADGGIEAYGTRYWVEPGGVSASGCLWSLREGRPETVFWRFFQGWDGTAGRPFFYQSHARGSTGMGAETWRSEGISVMEQDFWWTDGTRERVMHRSEWRGPDTHATESFRWVDGRWQPNRTYTWRRQEGGAVPCGPPSP